MSEEQAWCAGLFEGEGCINIRPPDPRGRRALVCVRLALGMTDRDVIERFAASVGVGSVVRRRPPAMQDHYKTQWVWKTADRHEVRRLLEAWLPWFGERRTAKAEEALAVLVKAEKERYRVCWCGDPFYAERNTKRCCCEAHTQIAYKREHAEEIKVQRRERHARRKASLTSVSPTLTP